MKKPNLNTQLVNELLKGTISLRTALHRIREVTGDTLTYNPNLWDDETGAEGFWENEAETITVQLTRKFSMTHAVYERLANSLNIRAAGYDTTITNHEELNALLREHTELLQRQEFALSHTPAELKEYLGAILSDTYENLLTHDVWQTTYDGNPKNYSNYYTEVEHTYATQWDGYGAEHYYDEYGVEIELSYNDRSDYYTLTIDVSTPQGTQRYSDWLTKLEDIDTLFSQADADITLATDSYSEYCCECMLEEEEEDEEVA